MIKEVFHKFRKAAAASPGGILRQGKYENRVFLQFLLLVTVPLIIMGAVSYNIYVKGEDKKNELMLDSYSESIMTEYENILSSIRQYYLDAVNGDSYRWLLSQSEPPYSSYSEVNQAQTLLQGNYFMTNYISQYNFLNMKEKWVLNNYGMFSYRDLKNRADIDAFLEEQKDIPLTIYWQNRTDQVSPYASGAKSSRMVDTTGEQLLIKRENSSGDISSLLMIQLNRTEMALVPKKYSKLGYHVTVLSDGKVLTETSKGLTDAYFNSNEPQQGRISDGNGVTYNILKKSSVVNNMTYIIGFDTRMNKKGASVFFLAALAVIAGFAVLLAVLRILASTFSKPILMLQKFVDDQNVQIKEQFICDLARGGLKEDKITENLVKFEVAEYPVYRLLAVICKGESATEGDKEKLIADIMAGLPESLKELSFVTPAVFNNVVLLIIGDETDFALDNKTALAYKQIKDYIADSFGQQIASGISQAFHKLTHTRKAYNECGEVLHNRMNKEDKVNSSLVLYDDYNSVDFMRNAYDIIMENELINSIDSCNEEESKRLLELILERMDAKGVAGLERNFYVTRLLTAIMSVPTNAGISLVDVFDSEQYNLMNQVSQLYNMKELVGYMEDNIIHPIIIRLAQERQIGVSDIVKQATKLIKDSKGVITLNECADALNYHPNYLSKVLIKEKGMSFTDMVNAEKLKLAKFMLLTTELPIAEISEKLQYNNVQNFIRFFKNQEGTTPSAFRKEHKH